MLTLSLPPTAEVLSPVRHMVREWLARAGFYGESADDVLMVVSELVTNGVIHDGGDDIELFVSQGGTGVTIEVVTADHPGGPDHLAADHGPRRVRGSTDSDESGRGLVVVGALTDAMSISDSEGRRRVICHVPVMG